MVSREDALVMADLRHPPDEMDNGGEVLARVEDVFHTEESDTALESFLPTGLATEISPAEEGNTTSNRAREIIFTTPVAFAAKII
jgi:hypothetical protein